MDARPWDFQAEECALRACVDRFNQRRYNPHSADPDFKPVDTCLHSVLGEDIELAEEFKQNYERWLEMEVYSNYIDWDQVINCWTVGRHVFIRRLELIYWIIVQKRINHVIMDLFFYASQFLVQNAFDAGVHRLSISF